MSSLTVVIAQVNPLVGDIPGNTNLVIKSAKRAETEMSADVIVFPELTLMAYPPEDLLLRSSVEHRISDAIDKIIAAQLEITVIVGYPRVDGKKVFNAVGVIENGKLIAEYAKQCLPNYLVFDDKRYFTPGDSNCIVDIKGIPTSILVCEDLWEPEPIAKAKASGAELVISLNASPFHVEKQSERISVLSQRVDESQIGIIYVNQIGGQDELVFDGGSMAVGADGQLCFQAPSYEVGLYPVEIENKISSNTGRVSIKQQDIPPSLTRLESIYQALVLGVRDYIEKNGFSGVVLGLSGGIDSALVLAIAADALGKDRVHAVMMPFHYTSEMSQNDAAEEAHLLGVEYDSISIEKIVDAFTEALSSQFEGLKKDTTEENLQARCRGNLLMAISNKKGYLVLTTGNKSEMAVGYATLYGDMAGGFDVLKDVAKTTVFDLARYRNSVSYVIPQSVIDRPPSAELAPDQIDEDSLPPYEVLDQILAAYIEQDESAETIISKGFSRADVEKVLRLVDLNEYKRRQSAIGPRITKRGFGRDRRYPITSGWKIGD
ncbi:NAD+ synthase [Aurantivibrio infirmus]